MLDVRNIIGAIEIQKELPQGSFISSVSGTSPKGKPLMNAAASDLGFNIDITTLTEIRQKIVEQKFYKIAPADFLPVKVGFGAWSDQLLTYKSFDLSDDFEEGIVDVANNSRIANVNTGVEGVNTKVIDWAKMLDYSLIDLQKAQKSGNWSLIESKERSRKKNWDLGIQKVAFLGHSTDTNVKGLLNLAGVTNDTTNLTKTLSSMTDAEFQTFISKFVQLFVSNSNSTAMPDTFVIPLSDWLGLGKATSATYPINSRREYLIKEFRAATNNPNAQVKPLAYCDAANNNLGVTRYALYSSDEDTLDMNLPVDYTSTVVGSINNFQFQSVAYGEFTGVQVYRPLEVYYFSF